MQIRWTDTARAELREAIIHIATENPPAAARVRDRIVGAVERLMFFPRSGRPGRVSETRELPVPGTPYVAIYRVGADAVEILRLLHGARRYP